MTVIGAAIFALTGWMPKPVLGEQVAVTNNQ
jgi:hypothetical protein